MASTGDLRNNVQKIQLELRQIQYSGSTDVYGLSKGDPSTFLPLLHHVLLDFSPFLSRYFSSKNYELYGKKDTRFLESVYKLLRDEFNYKPALSRDQFFSMGYAERKLILLGDVMRLCRTLHTRLVKNSPQMKKQVFASREAKSGTVTSFVTNGQKMEGLVPSAGKIMSQYMIPNFNVQPPVQARPVWADLTAHQSSTNPTLNPQPHLQAHAHTHTHTQTGPRSTISDNTSSRTPIHHRSSSPATISFADEVHLPEPHLRQSPSFLTDQLHKVYFHEDDETRKNQQTLLEDHLGMIEVIKSLSLNINTLTDTNSEMKREIFYMSRHLSKVEASFFVLADQLGTFIKNLERGENGDFIGKEIQTFLKNASRPEGDDPKEVDVRTEGHENTSVLINSFDGIQINSSPKSFAAVSHEVKDIKEAKPTRFASSLEDSGKTTSFGGANPKTEDYIRAISKRMQKTQEYLKERASNHSAHV